MPNRILRESICTSEDIERLTPIQEVAFYRILVQCDDYGRLDARPAILKARLFPLKNVDIGLINAIVAALTDVGVIERYSWDGRQYLQVVNWFEHQKMRTKREKYPGPDGWNCASDPSNVKERDDLTKHDSSLEQTVALNPNPNPKSNLNPNTDPNLPLASAGGSAIDDRPAPDGEQEAPPARGEEAPPVAGDDIVRSKSIELGDASEPDAGRGHPRAVDVEPRGPTPEALDADALDIAMRDGRVHRLRARDFADYRAAYPEIDADAELRRAALWLNKSGKPPGTKRAVASFLATWLRNASERAQKPAEIPIKSSPINPAQAYQQRKYPPGFFDDYFADLSAPPTQEGATSP